MSGRAVDSTMTGLLDGLFDARIRVASSALVFRPEDLPTAERELVARAIDSRQREFSTGRVLARTLMKQLGAEVPELLRDSDRVPRWPDLVVGSISHCASLCVAAVGESAHFRGIGLDVEPDEPVRPGVERVVCRDSERAWLNATCGSGAERARRIKIIFSVKEAVYKAFYPELRTYWSFQDVELELNLEEECFRARLPDGPEVREIDGRIFRRNGWILSGVSRDR